MALLTLSAWILFWLCDSWMLQVGPCRTVPRRLWLYTAFALVMAAATAVGFRNDSLLAASVPWGSVVLAFHGAVALVCLWIRRTDRYDLAWLACAIPAPVAWVLLRQTIADSSLDARGLAGNAVCLLGAIWAISIVFSVLKGPRIRMNAGDVQYIVNFAGWVHLYGAILSVFVVNPLMTRL